MGSPAPSGAAASPPPSPPPTTITTPVPLDHLDLEWVDLIFKALYYFHYTFVFLVWFPLAIALTCSLVFSYEGFYMLERLARAWKADRNFEGLMKTKGASPVLFTFFHGGAEAARKEGDTCLRGLCYLTFLVMFIAVKVAMCALFVFNFTSSGFASWPRWSSSPRWSSWGSSSTSP